MIKMIPLMTLNDLVEKDDLRGQYHHSDQKDHYGDKCAV